MRANDFELLLIRHGDAEDWSEEGDFGRKLTSRGEAAIRRAAGAFAPLGFGWSEAWTSPYPRAEQTATAIWQEHSAWFERDYGQALERPKVSDALRVEADPIKMAEFLVARGQTFAGPRPTIAAFGHQPNLEAVVSLLLTGSVGTSFSVGRGDLVHLFVPAPSHFDTILAPMDKEPLPKAVLLGFYPRAALELIER